MSAKKKEEAKNAHKKETGDPPFVPSIPPPSSPSFSLFDLDEVATVTDKKEAPSDLLNHLIQTQAWFRALTSQTGSWMSIFEPGKLKPFRTAYVSEGIRHVLGYEVQEFSQMEDSEYLHPDDTSYVRSALKRCAAMYGGREVLEYRGLHKDGSWRQLESHVTNCIPDLSIGGLLLNTRDITEYRKHENQLLSRVAWFAALLNQVTDALRVIGQDGSIHIASGRLNWLFGDSAVGFDQEALIQRTHPEDRNRVQEGILHALEVPGERIRLEFRARNKEQEWRYIELELFNRLEDTLLQGFIITGRDLTARKLFDSTTKLPSRTLFLDRVERLLQRRERASDEEFAVLVLDVTRFGEVNDGLGNAVGERLLKTIGSRLMISVRPSDYVGRLGRDQFTILLHGMRAPAEIGHISQRIHESVEQPCFLGGHKVFTTVTIGAAFSNSNFARADEMLQAAETAMHRGKQNGGSVTEMFDPAMSKAVRDRLKLEGSLRHAIERQELILHYQPIVKLPSRELAGFESLCRWERPNSGFVSPGLFIPIAEETGMINTLGEWVLFHACETAAKWGSQNKTTPFVSVNLSGKQLMKPGIVEDVKAILRRTSIDPTLLKLEVTETALVSNTDDIAKTLQELRALGLKLALDDFGTGYSSLNYLHRFPFNTIKIDRSFVQLLGKDENAAIIPTIIQLAKSLGMDVIAEGIETEEQAELLGQMGCPYGQGFLFARGIPEGRLSAMLKLKHL